MPHMVFRDVIKKTGISKSTSVPVEFLRKDMEPVVVQASRGEPLGVVAERAGIEIKFIPKFLFEDEAVGIGGSCGSNIVYVDGGYVRCNTNAVAKGFLIEESAVRS